MRPTVPGATQGVGSGHKNRRVRIAVDPTAVDMASMPSGGSRGYKRACFISSGTPAAYSDTSVSET